MQLKILIHRMCLKGQKNLRVNTVKFHLSGTHRTGAVQEYYSIYQPVPLLTKFITVNFFLSFLPHLVCCINDTLVCNISWLPNYYKYLWNCECSVPSYTICCCLLILGLVVPIKIAQWAQWSTDYKMWNQTITASWKVPPPEMLELGAIFLNCWSFRIFGISTSC